MNILRPVLAITCMFAPIACSQAASTPAALVKALQSALDKGDFEAARQLADIDDAPAELHFFFFDNVRECSSESRCTVSSAPADDALRTRLKAEAERLHALEPVVEGLIKVAVKSKDGSGSGTMEMPYAKVGGTYKVSSIHFSDAQFAALRAKPDQALVNELFAGGIRDDKGELRTDWAKTATPLPADGGEPGKAFVAQTTAMAAAVDAKDPDAAMNSGGQLSTIVFRDKDFEGKPIPRIDRQRKLQVQSLRMLRDVKVKGGYALGNDAVLIIEARNGIGWIVRGPIVLSKDGSNWDRAGDHTVSYLAEK